MKQLNLYDRAKQIKNGLAQFQKATINVDTLSAGGLLTPAQAKQFISWVFDSTPLLQAARTMTMPTKEYIVHGLLMEGRQARKVGINRDRYGGWSQGQMDSEDQADFGRTAGSYTITLAAEELALPRVLNEKVLQENIQGQNFANILAQYFATQFGLDIEDMFINGEIVDRSSTPISVTTIAAGQGPGVTAIQVVADPLVNGFPEVSTTGYLYIDDGSNPPELVTYNGVTDVGGGVWQFDNCVRGATNEDSGVANPAITIPASTSITWYKHHLLGAQDGWLYRIQNAPSGVPGAQIIDLSAINGGDIHEEHFASLLLSMPRRYKNSAIRSRLRWVMNLDQAEAWRVRLMNRATTMGDSAITGTIPSPLGIPILGVSSWPEEYILLTDPTNLIAGMYQSMSIRMTNVGRSAIMKNERYYVSRTEVANEIERRDACALGTGLNPVI